jgi:hypothetical protein
MLALLETHANPAGNTPRCERLRRHDVTAVLDAEPSLELVVPAMSMKETFGPTHRDAEQHQADWQITKPSVSLVPPDRDRVPVPSETGQRKSLFQRGAGPKCYAGGNRGIMPQRTPFHGAARYSPS